MRRFTTLAVVLAMALSACSDGEKTDDAEPAAESATVTVTAVDYGYTGLPKNEKSPTVILKNSGKEVHEIVAWLLKADDKRTAADLSKLPEAEIDALGPPAMVQVAIPGKPVIKAVGDGTLKDAGRYYVACFIQTGVDPAAYEKAMENSGPDSGPVNIPGAGPPHFTKGMYGEATIVA